MGAASSPSLTSDMISIVNISVAQSSLRRLSAAKTGAFRRLAGRSVVVDYNILSQQQVSLVPDSFNKTEFMSVVATNAQAVGLTDFNITGADFPAPTAESLGVAGQALSGTSAMAGGVLCSLIFSMVALANQ